MNNRTGLRALISLFAGLLWGSFLVWLYWPALNSYFANDDWVILWHNHSIPGREWWRYFNPNTIWFYRPLQSMQFGLTWQAVGLDYQWYNVQLVFMHLVVCGLGWLFVRLLFGQGVAWITLLLFSTNWVYTNVLFWKANFNTLQHAIFTMVCCIAFTRFLTTRKAGWYIVLVVGAILNCFTKESAVGLPLLLGLIWMLHEARKANTSMPMGPRKRLSDWGNRALKDMAPLWGITLVYILGHWIWVENIERDYVPGYPFVSPLLAVRQWMTGTNHAVFSFLYDPVFLPHLGRFQTNLVSGLQSAWYVPGVLILLAWWRKSLGAGFALLFTMAALFPHFALVNHNASRYYYLPALGAAMLIALIVWPLIKRLFDVSRPARRWLGLPALGALGWILLGYLVLFQNMIGQDNQGSLVAERAADVVERDGRKLPVDSVIILRNMPLTHMVNGMGATEMVRLLTQRRDLWGVGESETVSLVKKNTLESRPAHYLIDAATSAPRFIRIK